MPKLNPTSLDIAREKREQLARIFPEAFAEDKVDFEQLKRAVGEVVPLTSEDERFGLRWHGKADCLRVLQRTSGAALVPRREESAEFDTSENVFIEGDNLEALKLLQRAYRGRVKLIYIDPPYNTGKEFVYSDKYGEPLGDYLRYTGQKDDNGRNFASSPETAGNGHTKWLNMMYPRLYLARNLLRDDGVIFISIDDHELANLKLACDEIFGKENCLAVVTWQGMDTVKNDATHFSSNSEYILCYAKFAESVKIPGTAKTTKQRQTYKNRDADPRGDYLLTPLHAKSGAGTPYTYTFPNGQKWTAPAGSHPRFSKKNLDELVRDGRIYLDPKGKAIPQRKTYWSEANPRMRPTTFWGHKQFGSTRQSNAEFRELMGPGLFDHPKPVKLIKSILDMAADADAIVLDFFAGSATTAHAVMQLNAEDGGRRKFICIQLPEPCGEKSAAHAAGYQTIADIGRERIRRAAAQIVAAKNGQASIGDERPQDLGFRAFQLAASNFSVWNGDADQDEAQLREQLAMQDDAAAAGSDESMLYELLLYRGYALTAKVERRRMADADVYVTADGKLTICLARPVSAAAIDAIAESSPKEVICLDAAFANDHSKQTAHQIFITLGRHEDREVRFYTV